MDNEKTKQLLECLIERNGCNKSELIDRLMTIVNCNYSTAAINQSFVVREKIKMKPHAFEIFQLYNKMQNHPTIVSALYILLMISEFKEEPMILPRNMEIEETFWTINYDWNNVKSEVIGLLFGKPLRESSTLGFKTGTFELEMRRAVTCDFKILNFLSEISKFLYFKAKISEFQKPFVSDLLFFDQFYHFCLQKIDFFEQDIKDLETLTLFEFFIVIQSRVLEIQGFAIVLDLSSYCSSDLSFVNFLLKLNFENSCDVPTEITSEFLKIISSEYTMLLKRYFKGQIKLQFFEQKESKSDTIFFDAKAIDQNLPGYFIPGDKIKEFYEISEMIKLLMTNTENSKWIEQRIEEINLDLSSSISQLNFQQWLQYFYIDLQLTITEIIKNEEEFSFQLILMKNLIFAKNGPLLNEIGQKLISLKERDHTHLRMREIFEHAMIKWAKDFPTNHVKLLTFEKTGDEQIMNCFFLKFEFSESIQTLLIDQDFENVILRVFNLLLRMKIGQLKFSPFHLQKMLPSKAFNHLAMLFTQIANSVTFYFYYSVIERLIEELKDNIEKCKNANTMRRHCQNFALKLSDYCFLNSSNFKQLRVIKNIEFLNKRKELIAESLPHLTKYQMIDEINYIKNHVREILESVKELAVDDKEMIYYQLYLSLDFNGYYKQN